MKLFIYISLITMMLGLSSCDKSPFKVLAKGSPYDVVVVMSNEDWDGKAGEVVKEELATPVPYLLNPESSMKYSHLTHEFFDKHLSNVRNVLLINIDNKLYEKATFHKSSDNWAYEQVVLQLNVPDVETLTNYLTENKGLLIKIFTEEEMRRTRDFLRKTYSQIVYEQAKAKFDIRIYAPNEIKKMFYPPTSIENPEDCLWFTNNAPTGRMDILIYSFPFVDDSTFTLDYLVKMRDSITKKIIPGSFEGSYMSTEKRVVDFIPTTLNGKYCGVLKGLWRMEGDMMGGPFVSYARLDETNKRVIVTEGFVYEPRKEKKQYIRRLEAAMQTVLLPGETVMVTAGNVEQEKKKE